MDSEGTVNIGIPVKITQDNGKLSVKVGIGFVRSRIKDSIDFTIQKEMLGES